MKNLIEKINSEKINTRYSMRYGDAETLLNAADGYFDLLILAFRFGYMQGRKATQKSSKK